MKRETVVRWGFAAVVVAVIKLGVIDAVIHAPWAKIGSTALMVLAVIVAVVYGDDVQYRARIREERRRRGQSTDRWR